MDLIHNLFANLWSVFLVIVFFGGSIFVHELGHFLAARRRGVHVERFSIGFGPKIFSWRGRDGVEYRLSWLPLGGYVYLPQLSDLREIEGAPSKDVDKLPPVSYLTKVIVFLAGAVFNVIFAFLLACIVWIIGQPTPSAMHSTTVAEISPKLKDSNGQEVESPASKAGLKPGDVILKVDGKPVQWFGEIVERLAFSTGWSSNGERETIFTIKRGDVVQDLAIAPILSGQDKLRTVGFVTVQKIVVGKVIPGSLAESATLHEDDQITEVNLKPVLTWVQFGEALKAKGSRLTTLTVLRNGQKETLTFTRPEPFDVNNFGIVPKSGIIFTHPSPFQQVSENFLKTITTFSALVNPRSDLGASHMSGPIGIVSNFFDFAKEGLPFALWFTILVNVNLAMLNLLPIPVLDGGHILFATIGRLRGRALPIDFIAATQSVFVVLIFSMIIYISFFDVRRWARDGRPEKESTPPPPAAVAPAHEAPAKP